MMVNKDEHIVGSEFKVTVNVFQNTFLNLFVVLLVVVLSGKSAVKGQY